MTKASPIVNPRYKPLCKISTPIWHPNFRDGQICIGDIWGAGESLSDIIVNIGDMIQYKSWNSYSPLSSEEASWAIENKHIFPVGKIDLYTGESDKDITNSDFDIELSDEKLYQIENENSSEETHINLQKEKLVVEDNQNFIMPVSTMVLQKPLEKENDFEITADDLADIEFIPTAQRMQGQGQQLTKGKRINFKTIFTKGILFGMIGGIIGWLLQEIIKVDYTTVLQWMGKSIASLTSDLQNDVITQSEAMAIVESAIRIETAIFSCILGGIIGAVMGLGEGIYYGSKEKAIKYGLMGLGIALGIGLVGGYIAQYLYTGLLSNTTDTTPELYLALVRAIGWAVMGVGVGIAVGLIKPEKRRILNCSIGGLVGGFLGGFIFNYISKTVVTGSTDAGMIPRAIGITIMGILIGLGIGLLEQFAKSAWLKVIRGEFEGKEYLVFAGITSIGNTGKNTIVLFNDKLVAPNHCDIVIEGSKYVLIDKGSPLGPVVNGMRINKHILRQGDAIAIGNSVLIFNTK